MARKKIGEGAATMTARPHQGSAGTGGLKMTSSFQAQGSRSTKSMSYSAEQIRERAYYIFLERQRLNQSGDSVSDWCQAEHELSGAMAYADA